MSGDAPVGLFMRGLLLDFIPVLSVVLLILMTTIPTTVPATMRIGGLWPLIGIAYWSLARPRSMSGVTVFVLGLAMDIVSFVPFGIHAFAFVITQATVQKQRRFLLGQGFWMLWISYALLALCVYTVIYLLTSVFLPGAVPYFAGLVGVVLSWACFPLVNWLLERLHTMIDLFDEPIA